MEYFARVEGLRYFMQERDTPRKPDVSVLAALFDSCYTRLVRYLAVRTGNFSDAEDLASEVFARAVEAFDQFQWRGVPLEAWLFRIAHNLVIDYRRRASKRPQVPLEDDWTTAVVDAEADLLRKAEVEELNKALERLTEPQRQVLALRFGAEMTSEEAGKVLGKKAGTVRELQSSAVKTLRMTLGAVIKRKPEPQQET